MEALRNEAPDGRGSAVMQAIEDQAAENDTLRAAVNDLQGKLNQALRRNEKLERETTRPIEHLQQQWYDDAIGTIGDLFTAPEIKIEVFDQLWESYLNLVQLVTSGMSYASVTVKIQDADIRECIDRVFNNTFGFGIEEAKTILRDYQRQAQGIVSQGDKIRHLTDQQLAAWIQDRFDAEILGYCKERPRCIEELEDGGHDWGECRHCLADWIGGAGDIGGGQDDAYQAQ